jgi:hypothetical protein
LYTRFEGIGITVKDLIAASTSNVIEAALEYGRLALRQNPSEEELDSMQYILIQASNDPILDFWIEQIDYCLGHRLGLLDQSDQDGHAIQQENFRQQVIALLDEIDSDPKLEKELALSQKTVTTAEGRLKVVPVSAVFSQLPQPLTHSKHSYTRHSRATQPVLNIPFPC